MKKRGKIILVVDNDQIDLELTREILKEEFDTFTATSGDEALQLLKDQSFDLVITNLMMPKMDGFELLTIIKKKYPKIRVILVSATFGEPPEKKSYEKHADACLEKPLDINKLINTVKRLFGESKGDET